VEREKALVPLYIKRSEISRNYTRSSREYRNIDDQIKMLQQEISNEVKKAIATEELELETLKIRRTSLENKITQIQETADNTRQRAKKLNEMQREIELLKINYMLYASKTQDALIFSERKKRNFANVSIADIAEPDEKPSFPNRFLFLLSALFVGFFAAVGMPFILEFLDHRIKHAQDVEELLSLPVVSTIPTDR
jgi:uncharacterized protein involved in exopolysaccharide biosynthesis